MKIKYFSIFFKNPSAKKVSVFRFNCYSIYSSIIASVETQKEKNNKEIHKKEINNKFIMEKH